MKTKQTLTNSKKQFNLFLWNSLIISILFLSFYACNIEEVTPIDTYEPSLIESKLISSLENYKGAEFGDWVSITKEEYDNLANGLSNVNKVGATDAEYDSSNKVYYFPTPITVTYDEEGIIIPPNHFIIAFKYNSNGSDEDRLIKTAQFNIALDYTDLGGILPYSITLENYVLYKGNKSNESNNPQYLAFFANQLGYKISNENQGYYYSDDDQNMLIQYMESNNTFLFQALTVDANPF